ncbi:membrane-anchored ubiquitin-fold protein 3 [Quercus suber]|uniref:Membrane-anchored ubiquitin-fold protein 3 n=1 Tax=Quercus suber TaxID=58331 RepID=A0AAW0LAW9_QUESU
MPFGDNGSGVIIMHVVVQPSLAKTKTVYSTELSSHEQKLPLADSSVHIYTIWYPILLETKVVNTFFIYEWGDWGLDVGVDSWTWGRTITGLDCAALNG